MLVLPIAKSADTNVKKTIMTIQGGLIDTLREVIFLREKIDTVYDSPES